MATCLVVRIFTSSSLALDGLVFFNLSVRSFELCYCFQKRPALLVYPSSMYIGNPHFLRSSRTYLMGVYQDQVVYTASLNSPCICVLVAPLSMHNENSQCRKLIMTTDQCKMPNSQYFSHSHPAYERRDMTISFPYCCSIDTSVRSSGMTSRPPLRPRRADSAYLH